jgi:hypothetical protein
MELSMELSMEAELVDGIVDGILGTKKPPMSFMGGFRV